MTFTKFSRSGRAARSKAGCRTLAALCLALIVPGFTACRTPAPLAPVDLAAPGWILRQGQAVWQPGPDTPEIAGDLLVAMRSDGSAFVQFTKSPLTLAVAQRTPMQWQIEFPMQNRRYTGQGRSPDRLIWLHLSDALSGNRPPVPWTWQLREGDGWLLRNDRTGESLEGFLAP